MKINFDLTCIETRHLGQLVDWVKTLKHKEGSLSEMTYNSHDGTHRYAIWHNKKSYSVSYTHFKIKDK